MTIPPVAVVTGAGSGIGAETCQQLSAAGYRLTLVGRDERKLQQTLTRAVEGVAEVGEMLTVPADLADAEQAHSVIDMTVERWGRVDAIVNNAGLARLAPIHESSEDLLFEMFSVNTFGPLYLIARAWPVLIRQGGGCIVNISSMATADPFPGLGAYAASKAALESVTRSLHTEGAEAGIRAFAIAPGAVETPMLRGLFSTQQLPESSTLEPAEVASVVVDCVEGRRDEQCGGTIRLPSP